LHIEEMLFAGNNLDKARTIAGFTSAPASTSTTSSTAHPWRRAHKHNR
jgi:hypothetical protein